MLFKDCLFTSESVADGHPDKICDQISDAILDACLEGDPASRVAVETAIKDHTVFLFGEITSQVTPDLPSLVKKTLAQIGHQNGRWGFDLDKLNLITQVSQQSPDIAQGVSECWEMGAGDQGIMFGFACNETAEYMPLSISLSHALMRQHKAVRATPEGAVLGPDAKAQVTVRYNAKGEVELIDTVVLSTQHAEGISTSDLHHLIRKKIFNPILPAELLKDTKFYMNPTGKFLVGGPIADAGLTGRKIIVDTYGGYARHGGGAFSGKDPTKVDRSAAYAARQLAREVVAQGQATFCEVRLAYAIGLARPVAITMDTFGTGQAHLPLTNDELLDLFRPYEMIRRLGLRQPIYQKTAAFGHFGPRNFPWEQPLLLKTSEKVASGGA